MDFLSGLGVVPSVSKGGSGRSKRPVSMEFIAEDDVSSAIVWTVRCLLSTFMARTYLLHLMSICLFVNAITTFISRIKMVNLDELVVSAHRKCFVF